MKSLKNISLLLFFIFISVAVYSNKTSVKISTVKKAAKGSEVTVTISVSHNTNSPSHFTDWVYLKINSKEVKRWTYTRTALPASANFTLTFKFILTSNSSIEVMGDCNLHGSAGAAKINITAI